MEKEEQKNFEGEQGKDNIEGVEKIDEESTIEGEIKLNVDKVVAFVLLASEAKQVLDGQNTEVPQIPKEEQALVFLGKQWS